jgi:O-methyltransferase
MTDVETAEARERYINLLKAALRNSLYERPNMPTKFDLARMWVLKQQLMFRFRSARSLDLMKLSPSDLYWVVQGNLQPGHTLGSQANVNQTQFCVESVLRDGVPGDLLEAGVFRGGQSILMKGILDAYGVTDRKVFVADSFEGLPQPDPNTCVEDAIAHEVLKEVDLFAVSVDTVRDTFDRYGVLDDNVVFVKGFFEDSLPTAPVDKLAILRLDADYYQSTMDALENLYPKLSVGGWVILDDYGHPIGCRQAVTEFREKYGIDDPIEMADPLCGYWQRGEAGPKADRVAADAASA